MKLYANNKCLDLSVPQIMGILNFTPDSFSDSGQFFSLDKALFQVEKNARRGGRQLLILVENPLVRMRMKFLNKRNCIVFYQ